MTVEFHGLPYADCFAVEQRWVATREGDDNILLQGGVAVAFRKNTFLKTQIKAGTIEETTKVAKSLFNCAKVACVAANGGVDDSERTQDDVSKELSTANPDQGAGGVFSQLGISRTTVVASIFVAALLLWCSLQYLAPGQVDSTALDLTGRIDAMELEIEAIQRKLDRILTLLEDRG